jgi:hypothetical protein
MEYIITAIIVVAGLFVVFVGAGTKGKQSGGQQSAEILSAGLGGLGAFGADLESGKAQKVP